MEYFYKFFGIIVLALIIGIFIYIFKFLKKADNKVQEIIEKYNAPTDENTITVNFVLYSGIISWVTQYKISVTTTPLMAVDFLKECRRYNFIYGALAYGFVVIPIFTFFNYRSQMRKVQETLNKI